MSALNHPARSPSRAKKSSTTQAAPALEREVNPSDSHSASLRMRIRTGQLAAVNREDSRAELALREPDELFMAIDQEPARADESEVEK